MNLIKIDDEYLDVDRVAIIRRKQIELNDGRKIKTEIVLVTGSKYCESVWSMLTPEEVYGIIAKAIGQE